MNIMGTIKTLRSRIEHINQLISETNDMAKNSKFVYDHEFAEVEIENYKRQITHIEKVIEFLKNK